MLGFELGQAFRADGAVDVENPTPDTIPVAIPML